MSVIAHHGVLGQKWGVRRFQPYPKGYKGEGNFIGDDGIEYVSKKEFKQLQKSNKKEIKNKIKENTKALRKDTKELNKRTKNFNNPYLQKTRYAMEAGYSSLRDEKHNDKKIQKNMDRIRDKTSYNKLINASIKVKGRTDYNKALKDILKSNKNEVIKVKDINFELLSGYGPMIEFEKRR